MRPEELTAALRDEVANALPRQIEAVRGALESRGQVTKDQLENFLSSPAKVLSDVGALPKQETTRINQIIWAIHRSRKINDFMSKIAMRYEADPAHASTLATLASSPEKMDLKELQTFLDSALSDESIYSQGLRVVLEDQGVREALELPPDLTFERYVWEVRRAVKHADSIEEITKVSNLGPGDSVAFCTATVCIGVVAIATVAVIVHAAAVVWNYVAAAVVVKYTIAFTVAGTPPLAGPLPGPTGQASAGGATALAAESEALTTIVQNLTSKSIWLVYATPLAHVRVPVAPGQRSDEIACGAPVAVLIGGRGNELSEVELPGQGRRSTGAYKIAEGAHVRLVDPQEDDALMRIIESEAQHEAVIAGVAGWFDDPGLHMNRIAAAAPQGLDVEGFVSESHEAMRFYRSLRMARQVARLRL